MTFLTSLPVADPLPLILSLSLSGARSRVFPISTLSEYHIPEPRDSLHLRCGPRVWKVLDNALVLVDHRADEEPRALVRLALLLPLLDAHQALLRLPYLLGHLQHPLILSHLLLVLTGINQVVVAEVPPLELISLHLKLSLEAFLDFPGRLCGLARENPPLLLLLHHLLVEVAAVHRHPQEAESVKHQLRLDFVVQGGIGAERWSVIHFQEHWLAISIKHDVKAKNLKAEGVLKVVWLA